VSPPAAPDRPGRDTRLIWGTVLDQTIGWGTPFSALPLFGAPLLAGLGLATAAAFHLAARQR
jgi:hypothetical protein